MKHQLVRFVLLALFVLTFGPLHAVNDDGNAPCFGVHSLGWLDAAFYWREGTTWYKLATNDFSSMYPYPNSGQIYTCYLTADTADKETVSQASVPSVCEPASSGDKDSCLVFSTKQYAGDSYRYYRVYLGSTSPTDWTYAETWIGTWGQYELNQRIWSQMAYSTTGGITTPLVKIYTNHTDFQNQQSSWNPADTSWSIYSFMKETEVQIRTYIFGIGYVWLWYDTDSRTDSFKQFQVNIYKNGGGDAMGSSGGAEILFSSDLSAAAAMTEEEDIPETIPERSVVTGGFDGIFPAIFRTTAPEDEDDTETTSVKVETNDKGEAVALTVEWVDPAAGEEAKTLLEGMTVVAVNGIDLYDIGAVEEQVLYLVTEDIVSITFAE